MYNNISIISDIIPDHNDYDAHFKLKLVQTSLYNDYPTLCKDIYIETVLKKQNEIYLIHTTESNIIHDFLVKHNILDMSFIKTEIFNSNSCNVFEIYEKAYCKLIHIKNDLTKIILYVPHSLLNKIKGEI